MEFLKVHIPTEKQFYSLYSEGCYTSKKSDDNETILTYCQNEVLFLYYTYPSHRRAYIVRFDSDNKNGIMLPSLDQPVKIISRCHASKVDKLKKTAGFLKEYCPNAFAFSDSFYVRIHFIIQQKGKINYEAIRVLLEELGYK